MILYAPVFLAASCSSSFPGSDETLHISTMLRSQILKYFRTPQNLVGLSRRHYGVEHSLNNAAKDHVTPQDLCDWHK